MANTQKISIHSELDVVATRMQTRLMARQLGFSSVDQARISLAASELARYLSTHANRHGEIIINCTQVRGHVGIEVISQTGPQEANGTNGHQTENTPPNISSIASLVDEYLVETAGLNGTRITVMKWLN
jgi:serine/threonine-protein kinase RsbT